MQNTQDWNPRYIAYAAAHGRQPDAQLAHDKAQHPGASMLPFIVWTHRTAAVFA
jgi:hypothetical protein